MKIYNLETIQSQLKAWTLCYHTSMLISQLFSTPQNLVEIKCSRLLLVFQSKKIILLLVIWLSHKLVKRLQKTLILLVIGNLNTSRLLKKLRMEKRSNRVDLCGPLTVKLIHLQELTIWLNLVIPMANMDMFQEISYLLSLLNKQTNKMNCQLELQKLLHISQATMVSYLLQTLMKTLWDNLSWLRIVPPSSSRTLLRIKVLEFLGIKDTSLCL